MIRLRPVWAMWKYPVKRKKKERKKIAGHRWYIPVILATQEVEISRTVVLSQPGQSSLRDPISKKAHHKNRLVEWLKV
jgi:hypothetical protein